MSADAPPARARLGFGFWSFLVFMLALTGLFAVLGVWQLDRLAWKENLIAQVTSRLTDQPYEIGDPGLWPTLPLEPFAFHPIVATGHYLADKTVLVFTSLSTPKGKFGGPGYWVMTPLALDTGGAVFVNRGFVPQANAPAFLDPGAVPSGPQTVTGLAVAAEAAGPFTPGPDAAAHVEWVRDPARLAKLARLDGAVFGVTIDAGAGEAGALPQGGETLIDFPNNHLGYAYTWFGFALLTPLLLAAWVWRQLRPKAEG